MTVTLIRTVILYLLIIVGLRLLGKHQLGELEPSELVLALIIADLASVPMQDNGIPLLSGVIPIVVLLCLDLILSVAAMGSVKFRALICGRPSIIIEKGRLNQRELRKNRFTLDELMEELRCKGYTDLAAIEYAILETSGQLSVLPRAEEKPLTAAQFGHLNLHATFTKGTVEFRLFNSTTHAGEIKAYIQFCLVVSHQALTQKSASPRRTVTDNEKYAFRCWMLRLGLIGDEFKTCRLHFLKHLEGNSAWRHGA